MLAYGSLLGWVCGIMYYTPHLGLRELMLYRSLEFTRSLQYFDEIWVWLSKTICCSQRLLTVKSGSASKVYIWSNFAAFGGVHFEI